MRLLLIQFIFFLFVTSACLVSCGTVAVKYDAKDGLESFSGKSLGKHIEILSSDAFKGRMPFTEGEQKTLQYLEKEFKALQLEPGNGSSYLQKVPMVEITPSPDPVMKVEGKSTSAVLSGFSDYVIWTQRPVEKITLDKVDVVFAGYGIVAPEYNWDDYKGLDVKGKLVMVLVNDPGFGSGDTALFKGKTMTYYGRWPYKFEEAARHGAKGCLVIHNTKAAGYPFSNPQNNWKAPRLSPDPRGKQQYVCDIVGWISEPAARKVFDLAGYKPEDLMNSAQHKKFKGVPLQLAFSTSMDLKIKYDISYNAIATITGSTRPDEYIIYSAHWDHVGVGRPDEKGDTIYNGAVDNASGVAGLLEIAKAFKRVKNPPARTIVFLFLTAEEQGLVGSEYYMANPVYAINKTVANINLDALLVTARMKDIIVIGKGQSELEDYVKDEADRTGRYIADEPDPEAGYYFRSDHYNFAKAGIPALFVSSGIDELEKGKEAGRQLKEAYHQQRYHQPSDEYDPQWDLEGTLDYLKLLFNVGKRVAMEAHRPGWKEGSEFKSVLKEENK